MKALIFAAGRGMRMMPLTADMPKPMVRLLGKPLLERVFEVLPQEVDEVVLVVGYKGEMIRAHFGDLFAGRKITYVEQKEQLGTGNALTMCRPFISAGEKFLVIYADDVHDKEVIAEAVAKGRPAVFVARVKYPERFGVIVTDPNGRILGLEEAPKDPKTNLAVTGAYLLDSDIFSYEPSLEAKGEYYINSMLIPYMRDREVYAEIENLWIPIGYPEDIEKAEKIIKASNA